MERDKIRSNVDSDWEISYVPQKESAQSQQPGIVQEGLRNLGRLGMRGTEALLGAPGNIAQGLLSLATMAAPKEIEGKPNPLLQAQESLAHYLPTSEGWRELLHRPPEQLTPEAKQQFTQKLESISKPQGKEGSYQKEIETFADDFVKDFIPLIIPGLGPISKTRAAIASGLGNLGAWGAKKAGFGEGVQKIAKIGPMLLATLGAKKPLKEVMEDKFTGGRNLIPIKDELNATPLRPIIHEIEKDIAGIQTPSTEKLKGVVDDVNKLLEEGGGKINARKVFDSLQRINELVYETPQLSRLGHKLQDIKGGFKKLSEEYGKKNPEAVKLINQGNDIYQGIVNQSNFRKFVNNNINLDKLTSPITAYMLGQHPKGFIPGVLALIGIPKGINAVEGMIKSNEIRKYYAKAVAAAGKKNIPALSTAIGQLDKAVSKETSKYMTPSNEGFQIAPKNYLSEDEWEITHIPQ